MSELNAEPSTRFRAILEGAERAARNIETDFDDPTDGDGQFIAKCIGSLTRRTHYLRAQAAAQWKPQFVNVLKNAHSLRVEHADPMVKEMLRGFSMKCMACGRDEHRCTFRADLVGYFDRDDWQEARDLNASWTAFEDEYSACLECDPKGRCSRRHAILHRRRNLFGSSCSSIFGPIPFCSTWCTRRTM